MPQLVPQPFRHPKTGVYYYRKVVPIRDRERIGKTEFRISLRTKDLQQAKTRYLAVAAQVDVAMNPGARHEGLEQSALHLDPQSRGTINKTSPIPGEKSHTASLDALFEAWVIDRRPPLRTRYEWQRVLKRLEDFLGHGNSRNVAKADIIRWKQALIESGKSAKTTFNHLAVVRALFNWATRGDLLDHNPASGVSLPKKLMGGLRRLPYSDEDARLILQAARRELGARRWVPWLLAFTGARLEEICQARVTDVRQQAGILFLDINQDDPGKSLKNSGSARKVPLHPILIDEGFLDYLANLSQPGFLFPDLKPDRFGKLGGIFSKWYGRWARRLGIVDRRLVAHSWRHRFKDECRGAGIEKAIHDALTGHSSSDIGDGYGLGYPLSVLANAICKLHSPFS